MQQAQHQLTSSRVTDIRINILQAQSRVPDSGGMPTPTWDSSPFRGAGEQTLVGIRMFEPGVQWGSFGLEQQLAA
jgi:hypothetical protein